MSLRLQTGFQADFKLYAKTGAAPDGAQFSVSSSDPSVVTVTLDGSPQPVSDGEGANANPPVPDGTPSLASGTVAAVGASGSVTITFTQTNPDDTLLVLSDTIEVIEEETIGDLFGAAVRVTPIVS